MADYADFSGPPPTQEIPEVEVDANKDNSSPDVEIVPPKNTDIGLVYRFEIHLPDTQNVDTFRAIFKALREELM